MHAALLCTPAHLRHPDARVQALMALLLQSRSGCACAGPYGVSLMTPLIKSVIGITPEDAVLALEESPDNAWLKVRPPLWALLQVRVTAELFCSDHAVSNFSFGFLGQCNCACRAM